MKDTILKLINSAIGGAEDNFFRANRFFGGLSEKQLDKEYGHSGESCRSILNGYKKRLEELQKAKKWFLVTND